jgi:hypothetical protein
VARVSRGQSVRRVDGFYFDRAVYIASAELAKRFFYRALHE